MQAVIIARGTGYADDTTFDDYEVVRHPCPERADRASFSYSGWYEPTAPVPPRSTISRVTHASHSVALAQSKRYPKGGESFILLEHGGGRRVIRVFTSDDWRAAILQLPERMAYEVLRTTAAVAEDADSAAATREGTRWRRAHINGTVRKSRPKAGRVSVTIAPWYESTADDMKALRAARAVFEISAAMVERFADARPGFYFYGAGKDALAYGPYATAEEANAANTRTGGAPTATTTTWNLTGDASPVTIC